MKYFIFALALVGAVGIATPAFAESGSSRSSESRTLNTTAVSCIKSAVATRESALQSGVAAMHSSVASAYTTRASALASAYSGTDAGAIRTAVRTAWKEFKTDVKEARSAWKTSKTSAWTTFKAAAKTCKADGVADSGNASSDVAGG